MTANTMTSQPTSQRIAESAGERHLRIAPLPNDSDQPPRDAAPLVAPTAPHSEQSASTVAFRLGIEAGIHLAAHRARLLACAERAAAISLIEDPLDQTAAWALFAVEQTADRAASAAAPPAAPSIREPQSARVALTTVPPRGPASPVCVPGSPNCLPWCTDHATDKDDPHWQICFDDGPRLQFGDRGPIGSDVSEVRIWLTCSHPHPELSWASNRPYVDVSLNGHDGFHLEEEQVEPFACLLLAQLAVLRGDLEGARVLRKRIMTLTSAGSSAATDSPRSAAA